MRAFYINTKYSYFTFKYSNTPLAPLTLRPYALYKYLYYYYYYYYYY